jgi:hypothetical protein
MGARSRRKGAQWERDVANRLAECYPRAIRGVGQAQADSPLADVEGTPWWVECKVGQRPNIYAAIRQSEEARDDRPYLVVARKNSPGGSAPSVDTVTMSLDEFARLVGRPQGGCPCRACRTRLGGSSASFEIDVP